MLNSIPARQNDDDIVNLIAASKYLYSRTKVLLGIYFFLSVVLVVFFSLISTLVSNDYFVQVSGIEKKDISSWVSSYSLVVVAFSKMFLVGYIERSKVLAAKFQEAADRKLFGLKWDDSILGGKVCQSLVFRYSQKLFKKEGRHNVEDWYPNEIEGLPVSYQALVCQYSCLSWDLSLRNRYNLLLLFAAFFIAFIIFVMAFWGDMRVSSIFVNLIAIVAPVTSFGFDVYKGNNDSISNVKALRSSWDEFFNSEMKDLDVSGARAMVEKIQVHLYNKRKSDFPIPDSIYNHFRTGQQEEMFHTAKTLAGELYDKINGKKS
ncbi:hypothetical protein KV699_07195 [Vreelandella titanicae]|uniref:S-4TM family putative pore-forming effector n=1 Tax=Vreelandella titanicae TaxID=664683 RepID=UPI001EBDC009|nr:S-4TM family putative pore-forming effector [Halomonas sp.]MBL1269451.1 hypothetical protein [Halomonas sp.]